MECVGWCTGCAKTVWYFVHLHCLQKASDWKWWNSKLRIKSSFRFFNIFYKSFQSDQFACRKNREHFYCAFDFWMAFAFKQKYFSRSFVEKACSRTRPVSKLFPDFSQCIYGLKSNSGACENNLLRIDIYLLYVPIAICPSMMTRCLTGPKRFVLSHGSKLNNKKEKNKASDRNGWEPKLKGKACGRDFVWLSINDAFLKRRMESDLL